MVVQACASIIHGLFDEFVQPLINEFLAEVPAAIRSTGIMSGSIFEGFSVGVDVVPYRARLVLSLRSGGW